MKFAPLCGGVTGQVLSMAAAGNQIIMGGTFGSAVDCLGNSQITTTSVIGFDTTLHIWVTFPHDGMYLMLNL